MIKSKVCFNKGENAIITVPKEYINLMKINELENEVSIDVVNGKMIVEKMNITKLKNVSLDEMTRFILNNVKYTYNVSKCLYDFINSMGECGIEEDIFCMKDINERFKICTHYEILDENTVKYTYDVEKL